MQNTPNNRLTSKIKETESKAKEIFSTIFGLSWLSAHMVKYYLTMSVDDQRLSDIDKTVQIISDKL